MLEVVTKEYRVRKEGMNDMPQNIFAYRFGTLYSYKLVNAPEPQLVETKSPNLGRI